MEQLRVKLTDMKSWPDVLQNSVQQEHLIPIDDKKWQDLKTALNPFGAGKVFKEAIAAQLFQAEKQKAVDLQDVQLLQEAWETAAVADTEFLFDRVENGEQKFIRQMANTYMDIDWSINSDWVEAFNVHFVVSQLGL